MQTNRKSFGTLKSDRYIQATVMDERPLWQVLLYINLTHLFTFTFLGPPEFGQSRHVC